MFFTFIFPENYTEIKCIDQESNLLRVKFIDHQRMVGKRLDQNDVPTIISIIFWDSLMFYQIFLSSQLKRRAVITYKHGIHGLPNESPSDLWLRILGN